MEQNHVSLERVVKSVRFSNREMGFFESFEPISVIWELEVDESSDRAYKMEIEDGWYKVVASYDVTVKAGESEVCIPLGTYPVGWYRPYLKTLDGERLEHQYFAFTVTVPVESRYKGDTSFATDIAAEYEPTALKHADGLIHAARLQGYDWIRSRAGIDKWSDEILSYRKKLREAGCKTVSISATDRLIFPEIRNVDLRDVYDKYKAAPAKNAIVNDMHEIQNETDLCFTSPALPDACTAYTKAAALGLTDSEASPYVSMAGLAYTRECIYNELQMQNSLMDYSHVFNSHGYGEVGIMGPIAQMSRKYPLAYVKRGREVPVFMTENGLKVYENEKGFVDNGQLRDMCRYAIKLSGTMLSEGVDKWFWFISRPFLEHGGGFGSMHCWTYHPYPITATLASITYHLGKGEYLGKLTDTPQYCYANMFNSGMGYDAAILWAPKATDMKMLADKVTVIDLFGGETEVAGENGIVTVNVDEDGKIVKFHGRADEKNYYKTSLAGKSLKKWEFTRGERVVVNAIWDDQDLNNPFLMVKGYLLNKGSPEHIHVRVYNFNDVTVKGKVFVSTEYDDHFDIKIEGGEIEIEPHGMAMVPVTLTPLESVIDDSEGDVKFGVMLEGGEEASASVSRYWFKVYDMPIADEDIVLFKGYKDPENWDVTNVMAPGKVTAIPDGDEIIIRFEQGETYSQWFFPIYKVQNPEIIKGTDGIVIRKRNSSVSDDASVKKNKITTWLNLSDGRTFYSGTGSAVEMHPDMRTSVFPWSAYSLYYSPEGFNDIRPLDLDKIVGVQVGVSGTSPTHVPDTIIKDLGVYYARGGNAVKAHMGKITFEGVTMDQVYPSVQGMSLKATLPHDELEDVRVMYGRDDYGKWRQNGREIEISLEGLGRGEHIFQVTAKNKVNYRYMGTCSFFTEE